MNNASHMRNSFFGSRAYVVTLLVVAGALIVITWLSLREDALVPVTLVVMWIMVALAVIGSWKTRPRDEAISSSIVYLLLAGVITYLRLW